MPIPPGPVSVDLELLDEAVKVGGRRKGITASSGDALVAALAINRNARLFAIDEDFEHIARAVPLRLVEI